MWVPDSGIEGRFRADLGAMRLYVSPTGGAYTWWVVSANPFSESGIVTDLDLAKTRAIECARRHLREAGTLLRILAVDTP